MRREREMFFNRARVVKMLGSRRMEDEGELIRVFIVDTITVIDTSTSDIAKCKVEFVERLPYQAIRCSLV